MGLVHRYRPTVQYPLTKSYYFLVCSFGANYFVIIYAHFEVSNKQWAKKIALGVPRVWYTRLYDKNSLCLEPCIKIKEKLSRISQSLRWPLLTSQPSFIPVASKACTWISF